MIFNAESGTTTGMFNTVINVTKYGKRVSRNVVVSFYLVEFLLKPEDGNTHERQSVTEFLFSKIPSFVNVKNPSISLVYQ